MTNLTPALLERWMREFYFATEIDIGSSGVECLSLRQLKELRILEEGELDEIVFNDSPTLGAMGLRAAIARCFGDGHADSVIPTHGSSEAIFLIMNALLSAGDEIVVLDPCYQQLYSIAESLGCVIKRWPLRFEQRFVPDIAEAERLISSRTRMVIVNFPHNPTGATLDADRTRQLVERVAAVGAYLVQDEAFVDLSYEADCKPLRTWCHYERLITMGTLSKSYGLPGLRLGWCIASAEVLEQFAHLRDYTVLHLCPLVERLGQRVIENSEVLLRQRREQAQTNLQILERWIGMNASEVAWAKPSGGVSAFIRLTRCEDVEALCRRLATSYKTLLVPGSCFGAPQHARLGFGGPSSVLQEGLARLSNALAFGRDTERARG